ncbi:MAG: SRPBCC family protein [Rickettsiales bacterium]
MLRKILLVIILVLAAFAVVVALQPSEFRITRSATLAAPPEAVFPHVNNLHKWEDWSPWAKLDPNAKTTFEGPDEGAGAIMRWDGNQEVGAGFMTIVKSNPSELIALRLEFIKPFAGIGDTEFTFHPEAEKTVVTWTMSGHNDFIGKAVGLIMDCEKMVGGQFENGLANLKQIVESEKGTAQ